MSRYVPGRGFEPDPRGVNRKDPKAWADYQKRKKDFYSKPLGDHKGPFGMTIKYDSTKGGKSKPRSTSSLTIKSQKNASRKEALRSRYRKKSSTKYSRGVRKAK